MAYHNLLTEWSLCSFNPHDKWNFLWDDIYLIYNLFHDFQGKKLFKLLIIKHKCINFTHTITFLLSVKHMSFFFAFFFMLFLLPGHWHVGSMHFVLSRWTKQDKNQYNIFDTLQHSRCFFAATDGLNHKVVRLSYGLVHWFNPRQRGWCLQIRVQGPGDENPIGPLECLS